jgi:hypothetical protein
MAIGWIRKFQLQRKLKRALERNDISKAAVIDAHFCHLISDEADKSRESKLKDFRRKVSPEMFLDMLKVQYRRANEEGNEERAGKLEAQFLELAPDKASELSVMINTVSFLTRKITLLEKKAAVFAARYSNEKAEVDIAEEKKLLELLLKELNTLKEMLRSRAGVVQYPVAETQKQSRPPVSPMPKALFSRVSQKDVLRQEAAKQPKGPFAEQIEEIDKKTKMYQAQMNKLPEVMNAVNEAEQGSIKNSYEVSGEMRATFQNVLNAFSPKTLFNRLFKKTRKPFEHQKFIHGLKTMGEYSGKDIKDAGGKNAAFMKALISLFRLLPRAELEKLNSKIGHPVFKNFYRALDYYVDSDKGGQKLNLSYLVNNSDGLRELGPLVELQTYSSFFITAFHERWNLTAYRTKTILKAIMLMNMQKYW